MLNSITTYLLIAAMVAVAFTLVLGIFTMFRAKPGRAELSNRWMRLRVLTQAIALALLAILLLIGK